MASMLLRLLATVQIHERGGDAATALATELAVGFACDRVSIGSLRKRGTRLIAMSHQVIDKRRTALQRLIIEAMDEAIFQRATLHLPASPEAQRHILLAHETLSARMHNESILTVPMARDGKVYGALTLERPLSRPFEERERRFFEHVASLIGPVLELKLANQAPLGRLIIDRMQSVAAVSRFRTDRARWMLAAATLVLISAAFVPVPFRVSAPAHLEGRMQRALAAPADGFIKSAMVRPGDEVSAGQLMAELNEEEFRLERNRRHSEWVQLQSALGEALGKHDYAQIGVLSAKLQEARADLDLAEQQLQRTRIEAPFPGVVIKGDLSQSIGAPVRQGDTLFVLSPPQGHRVILDVDEKDISEVSIGQTGRLTLAAYPSQPIALTVQRITAMAVAKDGRNYFEVEATPGESAERLRPGLQGVAKIDIDRRACIWVMGHDAWRWIALWMWRIVG